MSSKHSSTPTSGDRAGEVDLSPLFGDGERPGAATPRALPRHLAPSQRRPGLIRSLLSAVLLVAVVLAVGSVVVLGSIDRLKRAETGRTSNALGSPGASRLGSPGSAIGQTPLLREGNFEGDLGPIRAERGTLIELVAGGSRSAHSARLSSNGPPAGHAGLLADQVTRPPGVGARYSATVVVKASRPGQVVQIQLIESVGGRPVSFDPWLVQLRDTAWREVGVQHEVTNNGSVLGVEVTFNGLGRGGQYVWVDNLEVTQTL